MTIMRACRKDVMEPKVKGEKWNKFGKSGANSQKTREQKNTSTTNVGTTTSHHN